MVSVDKGENASSKVKATLYTYIHDPDAVKKWAERKWQDTTNIDVSASRQEKKVSPFQDVSG
jgi:uncharacterized protein YjcR